jgi:RNA polymerase-binding transcription factor DksA
VTRLVLTSAREREEIAMQSSPDFAVDLTAVAPLSTVQRLQIRDLLDTMWRDRVVQITALAVRYHSDEQLSVAADIATARRALVEIEAAFARLDSGSYGRCDGCERRMPFEQLELRPQTRYCGRCQPVVRRNER